MRSTLLAALFTTCASAQLTTSVWLPGGADTNQSFVGSVVAQSGDHTTLSLAFADGPARTLGLYTTAPETVTLKGQTAVAYEVTGVDQGGGKDSTITVSVGCSRAEISAAPTCTVSTLGADALISELCAGLSAPAQYCTDFSGLTFDETLTLNGASQHYFNNFQVVITAGADKLGASAVAAAVATPTANSAFSTASSQARITSRSESGSATSLGSQTNNSAAASIGLMAPLLVGLGAAVTVLLL